MKSSDKELYKLRLQVFLSHSGVCSRRQAMALVQEGRVKLNGQVCREPSTPVEPGKDHVFVDGNRVQGKAYDYILLNKPAGYTTTKSDVHAQKTVLDLLPGKFKHVSPVGRLDRDTEGLLLLTNDGDVAHRLTHPKFNVDKTYFVRLAGQLQGSDRKKVERGVIVEGKKTAPCRIKDLKVFRDKTELTITIHEGRKRQVRLMFAAVGRKVIYLKRQSQGPLALGAMPPGEWRLLNKKEIGDLKKI
jgi:pseudouridine synthase